ncbi:MAG TPA: protein kinase [Vicinamibacterales bacterium]|nr:protein kinase [Vicinamibacterales bacterium]
MSLSPGDRLGPYAIVSSIGAGGMGEVYRAHDTKLGRDVAIKCLPDTFAADPDRLMRFEREARTLASLNHPHIAQVFGLEESGDTRALVMEFVDGDDLATRLKRGPLPLDEALPMARQIAEALEAAHAIGVIHRDLKPANIMVRDDGTVKVLDFGLAKALDTAPAREGEVLNSPTITSPAMTMRGVILGTAAYMSPEQAKGKPLDERADVWAFGCVLYEMLTGTRAFDGEDVTDTLAAILRSEPEWTRLTGLPPVLIMLIKRCIDRDMRRRIGDMSSVRFVLDDPSAFDTSRGPAGTPDSASVDAAAVNQRVASAVAEVRRRWRLRVLAPIVGLAVAAAIIAVVALSQLTRPQPAPPVIRFVLPLPPGQVLSMTRRMMSLAPDGQSLAYLSDNKLHVRRFAQFASEQLAAEQTNMSDLGLQLTSPTFSPDAASLAFHAGSQGVLKRISLRGGSAQRLCETDGPWTISWEASGILLGMGSGGVMRCNPAGGTAEQLVKPGEGEMMLHPQFLTDDAILLSVARASDPPTTRWDNAQVVVHSRKTGARRVVIQPGSDPHYVSTGHLLYRNGGILYAAPFDLGTQQVIGDSAPVIEGVARSSAGQAQMTVSDSGTIVYLPGGVGTTTERQLAMGDRGGQITRVALPSGPFVHVRASPDGKYVALGSDDGTNVNVWVYALDGKNALRRLTLSGRNRSPLWSPDGLWIAFQSDRDGDLGIYRQRADGTGRAERITTAAADEAHLPESWSPDGRVLSYSALKNASLSPYVLWLVTLADRKAMPFGGLTSLQPIGSVFSPDGRWLAYTGSPAGDITGADRGVFVQPFPANGTVFQAPRQLVDFHPMWSRDGRELIFLASTTARQMAVMPVSATTGSLTFGAAVRFPASVTGDKLSGEPRSFDLLPDGRVIGLIGANEVGGSSSELRVVINWFTELVQRVPIK